MNEQKRINYIKELSENGLIHEINHEDIKFLIDIASRLEKVANEFNPTYEEGQMDDCAKAYKEVMIEGE